jgi:drug/metabolite transporter (DMT)-like permease
MTPTAARPMTRREWGLLAFLSLLWGGSFFFNAVALAALPVLTLVAARVLLAALILALAATLAGPGLPRSPRVWAALLAMGLLNNVIPFSLIVWGQQTLASGVAAVLNATTPLFTALFAHWLTTDERLTPGRLLGALIGFGGVGVLAGPAALGALDGAGLAQIACLGAAVSYALSSIFGRRFARIGVAPLSAAAGQLAMSSLVLAPLALLIDRPWTLPAPPLTAIAAVLGLAALSTALAYVLFFRLLASAGATNIALVTLLVPVSAILLGVLFLGEALTPGEVGGMALIALGLAAIDGRPWARLRQARAARPSASATSSAASDPEA